MKTLFKLTLGAVLLGGSLSSCEKQTPAPQAEETDAPETRVGLTECGQNFPFSLLTSSASNVVRLASPSVRRGSTTSTIIWALGSPITSGADRLRIMAPGATRSVRAINNTCGNGSIQVTVPNADVRLYNFPLGRPTNAQP